jgi:HK97 gp10 family phage protein
MPQVPILQIENKKEWADLDKRLARLENKVGKKVVKKALRVATKVIATAAKANAKSMVGGQMGKTISSAITVRVAKMRGRRNYGYNAMTSDKYAEQFTVGAYYIPAAIEYGHAFPGRGGGKSPPKDVAAISFMRLAYEQTKGQAIKIVKKTMEAGIQAAAKG